MTRRGLVLSGGGAKGAFQVGVLAALHDAGYRWSRISGVSVGALNGAMLAQGEIERLEHVWLTLRESDIHRRRSTLGAAWAILRGARGVYDNTPVWKLIQENVDPARVKTPICVGWVSLATGEYVATPHTSPYFQRAVWASATMPIVWEPVEWEAGLEAVDGGVRNVTPLGDMLSHDDVDQVVMINCNPSGVDIAGPMDRIDRIALRTLDLMGNEIAIGDYREAMRINDLVRQAAAEGVTLRHPSGRPYRHYDITLIEPEQNLGDTLDFSRKAIMERYDHGYRVAQGLLGRIAA